METSQSNFTSQKSIDLYNELKLDGYKSLINKKEYAEIIGCSLSAVDNYISKGYGIPNYKKLGHQKNAKVLFLLKDVSEFLTSQTIRTLWLLI